MSSASFYTILTETVLKQKKKFQSVFTVCVHRIIHKRLQKGYQLKYLLEHFTIIIIDIRITKNCTIHFLWECMKGILLAMSSVKATYLAACLLYFCLVLFFTHWKYTISLEKQLVIASLISLSVCGQQEKNSFTDFSGTLQQGHSAPCWGRLEKIFTREAKAKEWTPLKLSLAHLPHCTPRP